jgi:hypothetical protein
MRQQCVTVGSGQVRDILAIDDTIWVKHRDDLENEGFPQESCHRVTADQELQGPLHHPTGIAFSWVNSGSDYVIRTMSCRKGDTRK